MTLLLSISNNNNATKVMMILLLLCCAASTVVIISVDCFQNFQSRGNDIDNKTMMHHRRYLKRQYQPTAAQQQLRTVFSTTASFHSLPPLSSLSLSSSSLLSGDDYNSKVTKKPNKSTAVYVLILISVLSFVADNIMDLPLYRKLPVYLYHSKWRWWQLFTSTICHVDKSHLSGNVFLLLLFGRSVEDELGPIGLTFSYIFCGVAANIISLTVLPRHTVSLGASGAVFGLFSVSIFSRLTSWREIFDWRKIIEVGVLGQFVWNQIIDETKMMATGGRGGVNHVAHLGGAVSGFLMILILRKLIGKLEGSNKSTATTTI